MNATPFPGNLTRVDYPGFLSQHDVVYLAPAAEGIDGLPIGNGDVGAMVWTPPDQLRVSINKVDLWDDGPTGPFTAWGDQDEEVSTMLRSAGSLAITHGLPSFDRLYLTDFEARLSLADGWVEMHSQTPFSAVAAKLFVSEASKVLVIHYRDETEEALPRRFELARWGTRSLLHWYRQLRRHDPLALHGTEAGSDGTHLWITQQLRALHFAVAMRLEGPARPRRSHRRAGLFESEPVHTFAGTIYVAVVNSEEATDVLQAAIERVDQAARQGVDEITLEHRATWQRFWEASFVDLPQEQDYVENLWYLNSYFVASASKGRYPLNHINAIYSWNRDIRPWAHYYHWNEQIHIWPLHTIGHGELALPYYRWRHAMLDKAMADAQRIHHRAGAFYSDVANRKGYQAAELHEGLGGNLTPGPQIAADFWRHYEYTRDRTFLQSYAYPVIREVSRFYLNSLQKQADGRYTFVGTQTYEGSINVRDSLTDLAHARQLFQIFVQASTLLDEDDEVRQQCQQVLETLVLYPTIEVSTEHWVDPQSIMDMRPVLFRAIQPGDPVMTIWSVGTKVAGSWSPAAEQIPDGTPLHEGMGNPATNLWIFTSSNMAPVFPANQVGLDQAGTDEFDIAVNTVKALGYDHQGFSLWIVAKARLGLTEELQESLAVWPQRFQIFPQGFSHWAMSNHPDMELDPRYLKKICVVDAPGDTIHWPIAISAHMSIEAMPMLQLAVNEMLLQSYSGRIRVFPAVPRAWEGRFRLHAVGQFVVSAVRTDEETDYVIIESKGGQICHVASPWPGWVVVKYRWSQSWTEPQRHTGPLITFDTEPEAIYLLLPENKADPAALVPVHLSGKPNLAPKTLGTARLGMPKGF